MQSIILNLLTGLLLSACGGSKNIDEKFRDSIDPEWQEEQRSRQETRQSKIVFRAQLLKVTENNLFLVYEENKGPNYKKMFLNVFKRSQNIFSGNKLVGRMICLSSECSQYDLNIYKKGIFRVEQKKVKILSKFNAVSDYEEIDYGIQYYFYTNSDTQNTPSRFYFSSQEDREQMQVIKVSNFMVSAEDTFFNSFDFLLPKKIDDRPIYFHKNSFRYFEKLDLYRMFYFNIEQSLRKEMWLKVEEVE